MKKTHFPKLSPFSLLTVRLLILLPLYLLLVACSQAPLTEQPPTESALQSTAVIATSTPVMPTDEPTEIVPTATDAPAEVPTAQPTEAPLQEATVEPSPEAPTSSLKIVYMDRGTNTLVLWDETAGTRVLANTNGILEARISDDGAVVAFTRELNAQEHELWSVNIDGTNLHLMVGVIGLQALYPDALGVNPYQFDFIPGTHTLAFNTVQYVEGPGLFLYDDLHFLNVTNNQITTQLTAGTGGNFVFSPDGQQYAVIQPEAISLHNTDGTNIRPNVLTFPYVLTYSEYEYYPEPVWSPDSTFLRVAIPPQDSLGDPTALTTLWEIPTDGSPATQIGEILTQPFFVDPVRFSPDLSKIAFTRLPDPSDFTNVELVIANADGSEATVYATGNLFFTGWAPDSQHFVFQDNQLQETYLGVVGSEYSLLTDIPYLWEVTWLDNTRFLFTTQSDTGAQLRLSTIGEPSNLLTELPDSVPTYDFDN